MVLKANGCMLCQAAVHACRRMQGLSLKLSRLNSLLLTLQHCIAQCCHALCMGHGCAERPWHDADLHALCYVPITLICLMAFIVLAGMRAKAAYPALDILQQKRLAAKRHKTTYCYDFPSVFNTALREIWAARAASGEPGIMPTGLCT